MSYAAESSGVQNAGFAQSPSNNLREGGVAQVLRAGVLLTYVFLDVAAALKWLPLTCLFAQILSVPSVRVPSLSLCRGPQPLQILSMFMDP